MDAPSFACQDWWARLQRGETPMPDLELDDSEAGRAIRLFDAIRVPDVPGQPAFRDAGGDWFRDVVAAIFGSIDPATGIRRVGEVFVLVPKKNVKTTGAAALALTFMLRNKRPRADMLIVAPTQKIAETAFNQAAGMIEAGLDLPGVKEGWLKDRLHVREHLSRIECTVTKSTLAVKTFDTAVLTGTKPVFVLVDETHELGKVPYAPKVYRQLRGGLTAPESVFVQITTQSDGKPDGIFKTELDYARGVRDGRVTEGVRMLPVLYEFPEEIQTSEDEAWTDPALWPAVNPNLGRAITLPKLEADYAAAKEKGQDELIGWATQHLNVEVGLALHAKRWRGADYWLQAGDESMTLDTILADSEVCVVGIDGGGLDDLLGLSVLGRDRQTRDWLHWAHAWAHSDVFRLRKDIAQTLRGFERAGDLTVCETPTQDIQEIGALVERISKAGLLPEKAGVGVDKVGSPLIVDEIEARVSNEIMVNVPQGYNLMPAITTLPKQLKNGTFLHCAQDLMTWTVGNAAEEQRGSNIVITKETAGRAKIDPLIATFNAFILMSRHPVAHRRRISIPAGYRVA